MKTALNSKFIDLKVQHYILTRSVSQVALKRFEEVNTIDRTNSYIRTGISFVHIEQMLVIY